MGQTSVLCVLENLRLRFDIEHINKRKLSIFLFLISLFCNTVWLSRNLKKFEKKVVTSNTIYMKFLSELKRRIIADFNRLDRLKFNEHWMIDDLFCNVDIDTDEFITSVDLY